MALSQRPGRMQLRYQGHVCDFEGLTCLRPKTLQEKFHPPIRTTRKVPRNIALLAPPTADLWETSENIGDWFILSEIDSLKPFLDCMYQGAPHLNRVN
jgi:hypothetical protein